MSPKALVPINVPARASAPTVPSIITGDMYYNTSTGLMIYDGSQWVAVSTTSALTEIDAGAFDGVAPYMGGSNPSEASTQTVNGGTP
jgi:hypothetical protein